MAEILITAYLVVGALASGLIWAVLIASKRRERKSQDVNYRRLGFSLLREHKTKPSRSDF